MRERNREQRDGSVSNKSYFELVESLILAQDERWRRA